MTAGILLLDKPAGLSSNAALQRVRRAFRADKAGHGGTLDPMATGMLPIFLGEATRFAGHVLADTKAYQATILFGAETDTGDREGTVVRTADCPVADDARIEAALARFRGRIRQTPPVYSAIKQQGMPLYALARQGIAVEVPERTVDIHALTVIAQSRTLRQPARLLELQVSVTCGSGTYIRSLAQDIGRALDSAAHLVALRRSWVGGFRQLPMVGLETLERAEPADRLTWLHPVGRILAHLPAIALDESETRRLVLGQRFVITDHRVTSGPSRLVDAKGEFLGLGELDGQGVLRVIRLMPTEARRGM